MRRSAVTVALCSAIAAVLCLIRPHPVAVGRRLGAPDVALQADPDAMLADVSSTLLWLVAAWLAVGIAATALGSAPGAVGRLFGTASRRMLPGTLRRVVAGSAGLGVLLAPVPVAVASSVAPPQRVAAAALPAPVWPGAPAPVSRPDPAPQAAQSVRVQPGDSLWLIAAHRLGSGAEPAEVAAAWPRWYAANRAVIGNDPDLVLPGQLLSPPERPHSDGAQR